LIADAGLSITTLSSSYNLPVPSVVELPATAADVAIGTVSAAAAQTISKHTASVQHEFHQHFKALPVLSILTIYGIQPSIHPSLLLFILPDAACKQFSEQGKVSIALSQPYGSVPISISRP